ncbi:MarR family winged helix-turn-helix transcriptional regulator [Clostridium sp. JS66]|uniref:MarR family winged helix-turn-helix transcriptional regulator n=1 Tax=Clostridium sp. JS66 TaxID=3064705 RepID=UPI00298D610D|nr:MarR family winged helix-turn-helix transcriptional regulator [Clostridium sp. JS66]WPC43038.1 MarR family winged helix-turn-helix transcriptional regulator [Clostridium sp. JS66]
MQSTDIISLISKIRDSANKFITNEMDSWGVKGLVPSHGDILFALLKSEKLTMKELSEKIQKDKSTVTVLVNKLIQQGYVEKTRDIDDNRVVFVTLTEKGKGLKTMFDSISKDLLSTVYKDISENEKEDLINTLIKIKNNF